jgi:chromosomal replication initiation ATPase DnaA
MQVKKSLAKDRARARLVVAAVAIEFGVKEMAVVSKSKGRADVAFARQVAMYMVHCIYGVNRSRVAAIFHRDRSTVTHACCLVEDSREDRVLDDKLIKLENFLRQAPEAAKCVV